MKIFTAIGALALILPSIVAAAAEYPGPKEGEWLARDFKYHTGEMIPELKLHYTTVGDPAGTPVVVLHGTGSSAAGVLTSAFAGECMFGSGAKNTPTIWTRWCRWPHNQRQWRAAIGCCDE